MDLSVAGCEDVNVFVGKEEPHAVAIDRAGKRPFDRALPNDQAKFRQLLRP